ncbi:MAG TPA: PTS sugar transporter subunit IIA [Phycisphaerae bacterium]|jgi:mannitol/fructose-specific phosphotransferase system IIA component (Ntr-type)
MKLTDIISPECVAVPLVAGNKLEAIERLVDLLADARKIADRASVLKAVLDREQIRSTGIGYGLAVPHAKSPHCPKLVMCIGKPDAPIEFDAPDRKPASMIVLLVSPLDQTGPHIQALARISRLMLLEAFRAEVAETRTAEELYQIIARYEA